MTKFNLENTSNFSPISLNQMDGVKLMNRSDTKFTFGYSKLASLLEKLIPYYQVLEIDGKRIHSYKSLYFDTQARKFYNDHHNRRINRHKIRFREYVDSGLVFLEIKRKNNKGKTLKKRLKVNNIPSSLSNKHQEYIEDIIGYSLSVHPKQWINFSRITLVHKYLKERLTIDINLNYDNGSKKGDLSKLPKRYYCIEPGGCCQGPTSVPYTGNLSSCPGSGGTTGFNTMRECKENCKDDVTGCMRYGACQTK